MLENDYEWEETNAAGSFLYYKVINGAIIGEVSSVGPGAKRSMAAVYTKNDQSRVVIGQFINSRFAKKAVEDYWRAVEGTFIEMQQ